MPSTGSEAAALIALDWGSTNLRAALLDRQGRTIDHRSGALGLVNITGGAFEEALRSLCADWLADIPMPILASGMIGSRQGWCEAPYLDCPAYAESAAGRLTTVRLQHGGTLFIVPGLRCLGADGLDDVMRGEETQIWGGIGPDDGVGCAVLPGTHSKWAWLDERGGIAGFATYMTGELYALLTEHGLLGRLMQFGCDAPEAFARGVRLGLSRPQDITHLVFSARTAGLMNRLQDTALPDYLSGLLIGAEVASAQAVTSPRLSAHPALLIGEPQLCERYARALAIAGIAHRIAPPQTSVRGQWRLARAAGLV